MDRRTERWTGDKSKTLPVCTRFPLSRFPTVHRTNTNSVNYLAHIVAYVPQREWELLNMCTYITQRKMCARDGNGKDGAVGKFKSM